MFGFGLLITTIALAGNDPANTPPSKEMMKQAEEPIRNCEARYQDLKALGQTLDKISIPSIKDAPNALKAYKNKTLYKKTFDQQFGEFANFTSSKAKIRNAKSIEKLRDEVAAYNSNCVRFADGISKFVEWAKSGGTKNKDFELIFNAWVKEAQK